LDHISHNHILKTLSKWKVTREVIRIVRKMLETKVKAKNRYETTTEGTPQGGILSPMLANVALTAFDEYCAKEFGKRGYRYPIRNGEKVCESYQVSPLVRYADDFIITAETEKKAEQIKENITKFLKKEIELELSLEKTHITNVHDGFNFLGFNIRKYRNESRREVLCGVIDYDCCYQNDWNLYIADCGLTIADFRLLKKIPFFIDII